MNKALITPMFILALSLTVAPAIAKTLPAESGALQDQIPQTNHAIPTNEQQEYTYGSTESEATITVTATPLHVQEKSRRKHSMAESPRNRPSREDWTRCLQNENCRARSLFNNQWDRVFGPASDFGN